MSENPGLSQPIEYALAQVSKSAQEYYRKLVPFIRGYNIAHENKHDYEAFKKDLEAIFELAKVGLIAEVSVRTTHPYGDEFAKMKLCHQATNASR